MNLIQTLSTALPAALMGKVLMGKPTHLLILGVAGAGVGGYIIGGMIEGVVND
jgi:hypothetical protein|tara:strand:- start:279 stop:437 length:159 start_codon:yes stop_codon:yes gene_type:complete